MASGCAARTLRDFTPSPEPHTLAEKALPRAVTVMKEAGVTHQGDIVVVNGSYEARPSTAPAKSRWAGRFHVRAVLGSARHPLSGMWGVEASELREVAKSPLESDRSIISGF